MGLERQFRRLLALPVILLPIGLAHNAIAQDASELTPLKTDVDFDFAGSRDA